MKKRKWLIENNFQLRIVRVLIALVFIVFIINVAFFEYFHKRTLSNIQNFFLQTEKVGLGSNSDNCSETKKSLVESFIEVTDRFEMTYKTTLYLILIFALFAIIVAIYSIFMTQKIVGPFLVLKNMLINLLENKRIRPRELRKEDFFREHFEEINNIIKKNFDNKN